MIYSFLSNLLKTLNIQITKTSGRVIGKINPNIKHSSEEGLKNLYNNEAVSPQSNRYPIIPKIIIHHIFYIY